MIEEGTINSVINGSTLYFRVVLNFLDMENLLEKNADETAWKDDIGVHFEINMSNEKKIFAYYILIYRVRSVLWTYELDMNVRHLQTKITRL